jgi:hypothetical protein
VTHLEEKNELLKAADRLATATLVRDILGGITKATNGREPSIRGNCRTSEKDVLSDCTDSILSSRTARTAVAHTRGCTVIMGQKQKHS